MINISDLWFTQRSLNRSHKIPDMIKYLNDNDEFVDPIELRLCSDGEIEINNGHHRVTAIWRSGRRYLRRGEYIIWDTDDMKSRFYKFTAV